MAKLPGRFLIVDGASRLSQALAAFMANRETNEYEVLHMNEIMQDQCCSVPEALMIMEVIPLCEIGRLQGDACAERLVERVALGDVEPISNTQGLPVRCASVLSCQDALRLARRLKAFSF